MVPKLSYIYCFFWVTCLVCYRSFSCMYVTPDCTAINHLFTCLKLQPASQPLHKQLGSLLGPTQPTDICICHYTYQSYKYEKIQQGNLLPPKLKYQIQQPKWNFIIPFTTNPSARGNSRIGMPCKDFKDFSSSIFSRLTFVLCKLHPNDLLWITFGEYIRPERGRESNLHCSLQEESRPAEPWTEKVRLNPWSVDVLLMSSLLVWKSVWCVESNYGTGFSANLASTKHFCHHQSIQCTHWYTPQVTPENPKSCRKVNQVVQYRKVH